MRRFARTAALALAVTLGGTMLGGGTPAWAEVLKVEAEASLEKGFGRLILTFKGRQLLPQYTTRLANGVFVLDFVDDVDIDIDRAVATLAPYLTVARRDPEGKGVRLGLTRQVKINTMEAAEKLFIDFLPAKWAGAPPTLPPEVIADLAKRAEEAIRRAREAEMARSGTRITPKLDFKLGRLPTFNRFSFGWNVPFDTRMSREDDRVTITFNRAAKIDLSQIDVQPVAGLKDIYADTADDKLKIVMTVTPEADVRGFREDDTYVLDLVRPSAPANVGEAAARAALGDPSANGRDRMSAPGKPTPTVAPPAGEAHAPAATTTKANDAAKVATAIAAEEASAAPTKAEKPEASTAAESRPKPAKPTSAPVPAPPAAKPAEGQDIETTQRDLPTEGRSAPPAAAPSSESAPPPPPSPSLGTPPGEVPGYVREQKAAGETLPVRVEVKRIGDIVRMSFPFPKKIASAAFKRESSLWVVFDTGAEIDISAMAPNLGPLSSGVVPMRANGWQAIRIDLTNPLLTTLGSDGNNWVLSVGEMVLEPAKPLKVRRSTRGDGNSSLKIDLPDGGAVHELRDEEVGDRLVVVTAFGPARGLFKSQSFVDVDTLASAHGVALVPHGDDLSVVLESDQVTIGRERGLNLSTGEADSQDISVPRTKSRLHNIPIDPKTFGAHDTAGFEGRSRELLANVIEAKDQGRRQSRIDLAEFYIGHRFAPEALAQLRILSDEDPGMDHDPGFVTLYGAAQALAGRAKPAHDALARSEVADSSDAALWRTVVDVDLAKWDEARDSAIRAINTLGAYPREVQALFNISAAEAAIELNDLGFAEGRLAEIEPETLASDLAGRYEVLQARLADAAGRPEDAMSRFERAKSTGDRKVQAQAEYLVTRALLRDGKIDKEEAIERMKSLAFGWRGDEVELHTLRFLAGLQADTGRYREAFQSMRSALMVDPNSATTRLLQDEMGQRFQALYLDDADKAMPPIEALTLYYDFRELVPIGRRGDEVVRKLADRLVAVDLLPQAAELLSYQVDNRLKGAARAQIAADLATVYLQDRKPERALAVLNKTRQSPLPLSLERQRRMVEVRALSDSGRGDLAMEMLASLSGSDVLRLKADVMWKAKKWREAGERLEALLGGRWQDGTPLDDQERQDVLRAGIGFALANDQISLDRLRGKYAAKMAASPNAHTFDVVTQPIQTQGGEFRAVAKEIASLDTMRQFIQEYRAQYLDPKARTVVPDEPAKPAAKPADAKPAADAAPPKPEKVAAAEPPKEDKPAGTH